MTEAMAQLWKVGENVAVGMMYSNMTRNQDKAVRDLFKVEKSIRGTRSWAIATAMSMANPSVVISDDDCAMAVSVLIEI